MKISYHLIFLPITMFMRFFVAVESVGKTLIESVPPTVEHAVDTIVAAAHAAKKVTTCAVRKMPRLRTSTAADHVAMLRSRGFSPA